MIRPQYSHTMTFLCILISIELRKKTVIEKEKINDSQSKIARYKEQLDNVRNNREFDLLSKEVEFQALEIELCEKHLNEYARAIDAKNSDIAATEERLTDSEHILKEKKAELDEIVEMTKFCGNKVAINN